MENLDNNNARMVCEAMHGALYGAENDTENKFVASRFPHNTWIWTDINDRDEEGKTIDINIKI